MKQLYYDVTKGILWYENNEGEALFWAWIEDATELEIENMKYRSVPNGD